MPRRLTHRNLSPALTKIAGHLPSVSLEFFIQARSTCNPISNASCPSVNEGTFTIASWMSAKCNFIVARLEIDILAFFVVLGIVAVKKFRHNPIHPLRPLTDGISNKHAF
jgi:hypothetical protein